MIHEITTYRGSSIYYHEDMDTFSYDNIESDVRQTILDAKNSIDKTIEIRQTFVPFKAFKKYFVDSVCFAEINVISILPNGALLFTDEGDNMHTLDISKRNLLFNADADVINTLIVATDVFELARLEYNEIIINVAHNLSSMDLSHL